MKEQIFDKIQGDLLNKFSEITIDGYLDFKIKHPLYTDSYAIQKISNTKILLRGLKKIIIKQFDIKYINEESDVILLQYDYGRKDHNEAWMVFTSIFKKTSKFELKQLSKFQFCNIKKPNKILKSIIQAIKYYVKLKNIQNKYYRFYFAADLVPLIEIYSQVLSYKNNEKVFCCYFDGGYYESTIVQALKKKGIITVTLQHGQPVFHGFSNDYINQAMILNFCSDYILVSGKFSEKQFLLGNIGKDHIKALGSLRKRNKPVIILNTKFLLLLDGPTMPNAVEKNFKLIQFAEEISCYFDLYYDIKLHPFDAIDVYKDIRPVHGTFIDKNITIAKASSGCAFAVIHASGAMIDLIALGLKTFCFKDDFYFPIADRELDIFKCTEEIVYKLSNWIAMQDKEKEDYLISEQIYYLGELESNKLYLSFFQSLGIKKY